VILPLVIRPEFAGAVRNEERIALEDGDTIRISLSADLIRRIKEFIQMRNLTLADINNVVIKVLGVYFDNGLMWATGHYYRRNPAAQGRYERIDQ
jgi:hypothetical protein